MQAPSPVVPHRYVNLKLSSGTVYRIHLTNTPGPAHTHFVNQIHGCLSAKPSKQLARLRHRPLLACGRRLVLVDIENIANGPCLRAETVRWVKHAVTNAAKIGASDHVVVATSHINLLPVGCNWSGIRYVVRSGPDGADLALLDVLTEDIPGRYEHVVLASGDGIFAPAVARLARAGVTTTVLGLRGTVARTLQLAASRVIYLPGERPMADPQVVA